MKKQKEPTGTREWATSNINICVGCKNNCRYCYAKKMAIRFERRTEENWKEMELNPKVIDKKYTTKRKGRIMFPSTHDITPEILDSCIIILQKLLKSGNEILITSKPDFVCIREICNTFPDFKNQIQFRFTIGSINSNILKYWEEGAPSFEERFISLKYAFDQKYKTSISIEPFLDNDPEPLVKILEPYVTESIWIGKMNYIQRNNLSVEDQIEYNKIRKNNKTENILNIYHRLKTNNLVRWKDSIKKILKKENINY